MKVPNLQREEWDFSACLEAERETCVHYEYAREYVRNRPDIAEKLKGRSRVELAHRLFAARFSKHKPRSYILPIMCSQFPATPWLKIPREERQDLIALCSPHPGESPNDDLLTDAKWELSCLQNFDEMRQRQAEEVRRQGEEWVKTNGYVNGKKVSFAKMYAKMIMGVPPSSLTPRHFYAYTGHTNYAVITLDWRQSNNQLKHGFELLLKRRPEAFPDSGETAKRSGRSEMITAPALRGGRGGAHDKFKQLAALRILTHYVDPEKIVDFLSANKSASPYKNAVNVQIAARKARTALTKMEAQGQFAGFTSRP